MRDPCYPHYARDIYTKPRTCVKCGEHICNYPIPVHRGNLNKADEENVYVDIQLMGCVKTLGHEDFHDNPLIKPRMRFQQ